MVTFKWIAKDEGDGQISRDLILHKEGAAGGGHSKNKSEIQICFDTGLVCFLGNKYKITVYTGNKIGAGTDADVFITLYGDKGESGAIILDDKKNNFESGQYVMTHDIQL